MKTEPTDEEINGTIAEFCGWKRKIVEHKDCAICGDDLVWHPPSFTTSFDALREAIGKMNGQQQGELLRALYDPCAGRGPAWLLCDAPVRTLAEAVYQVVKGENK